MSYKVIFICYSINYALCHFSWTSLFFWWKIRSNTIICLFVAVPPEQELTAAQIVILRQTMNKIRETVHRIASEHRDLHSTVSKVGKAIDRVSISYYLCWCWVRVYKHYALYLTSQLFICWSHLLRYTYEEILSVIVYMWQLSLTKECMTVIPFQVNISRSMSLF